MRKITINFEKMSVDELIDGKYAGYLGEHNATEIIVAKPTDLSGSQFSVAFQTNGEVYHSKFFSADEDIVIALWQQLTQDNVLCVQLESYDENGAYIGKSATVRLLLNNSVCGTDVVADADNPDVYSEIAQNSSFRETLEDNLNTLDKLTTSETGKLLFDGKLIEGSGGGSSGGEISSELIEQIEDNTDARHTHTNKDILDKFGADGTVPTFYLHRIALLGNIPSELTEQHINSIAAGINPPENVERHYISGRRLAEFSRIIDQKISLIPKFLIKPVDALPETDISETTVYLVRNNETDGNLYTEYIYVNGVWESLGSQSVDLTGYYTKEEIDEKGFITAEDLPESGNVDLSNYYTKEEIDDKGFVTEEAVEPLSDIQYSQSNLFDPNNITHNSRYDYTTGDVATATSTWCRTTNLIKLDSTKEYNVLYYLYLFPGTQLYIWRYDENGNFIEWLKGTQVSTDNGMVMFSHITNTGYIGFAFQNFSGSYPESTPQTMLWESTDKDDYNVEFVEYGSNFGNYMLPRLEIHGSQIVGGINLPVKKSPFHGRFLNVSYSEFERVAPQNTMETYLTACKMGFDAIKGDVRITSDDKLVMCHDAGFTFVDNGYIAGFDSNNCTLIRDMTFEECKSKQYTGATVMMNALGHYPYVASFEDYIKICREYDKVAYITVRDEYIDIIAPLVLDYLKKYNMLDNAIINSFTIATLQTFRTLNENITLSYVLPAKTVLTNAHIDTAISLGNCQVCLFAFPFDTSWKIMDDSVSAIEYATQNDILVYGAQVKTYEDYIKCIEYGLSGLHILSIFKPYEPKRYNFKVVVADGTAEFSDMFTAARYTANVSTGENTISISDIRLNGSGRGFDDGLMQMWLNRFPYVLDIREESGKTCSASYSGGIITITTNGETSATYHLSITV